MRNIINNIYVKNIPKEWTETQVRELFIPFGHIKSCILQEKENIG
jgi:RNA recognition motif-containing protein